MSAEKYAVFPLESDPKQIARGNEWKLDEQLEEGTFFVIRSSDVFGAAALYAYAHLVQTAIELDLQRRIFTDDEREFHENLSEHVVKLAQDWQVRGDGRLPD